MTATATRSRLASGCEVVTERVEGARSAALGVFVTVGSRHEPKRLAGASHFLEHLLFKGTDDLDALELAERLDRVGGQSNAYTAREHTCFWVRLLGEDLQVGLDILGGILAVPALRDADVTAERTVIEDEILGSRDDPASVAGERCFELLFDDHPLGRDPLGTLWTVRAIGEPEVRGFFERHYGPGNLVVAAAGDVDHDEVVRAVESWPVVAKDERPATSVPGAARPSREVVRTSHEQAQVVVAVRIPARTAEGRDAYRLYDQLLGGGLSSRLFTSVRERHGLAYQVYSERAQFTDAGALCVAASCAPEHADRVLELMAIEVDDLADGGLQDREVETARQALRADALLSAEDSGQCMSRIGATTALDGAARSLAEVLEGIAAVTKDQLADVARQVASAPRTLVCVGALEEGTGERLSLEGDGWWR